MSRVSIAMDCRFRPNLVNPLNSFWTDVTSILSLFTNSSGNSGSAVQVAMPNCLAWSQVWAIRKLSGHKYSAGPFPAFSRACSSSRPMRVLPVPCVA